jgi:hypothetical protein
METKQAGKQQHTLQYRRNIGEKQQRGCYNNMGESLPFATSNKRNIGVEKLPENLVPSILDESHKSITSLP